MNGLSYSINGTTTPLIKIFEIFLRFEERKKYLGLDELTLESLEAELGPEVAQEIKDSVRYSTYCSF